MAGPIIRLKDMTALTGLSRATIYNRMNKKSGSYDPTFPMSISLGGSAVGWFKEAVDAWLVSRGKNEPVDSPPDGNKEHSIPKPATSPVLSKSKAKSIIPPTSLKQAALNTNPVSASPYVPVISVQELFQGADQNGYLTACLRLDTWTPAMGALLVSGIKAQPGCCEIPLGGDGVDGQSLDASNSRFDQARSILRRWAEQNSDDDESDTLTRPDALPCTISPVDFFIWCDDEQIDTDWLRLIKEIAGCPAPGSVKLIPTSIALQIAQSTQSSCLLSDMGNDSAKTRHGAEIDPSKITEKH